MMGETWFEKFKQSMNVEFTEEDFRKYYDMMKAELPFYRKYLRQGARILDIGCGLGCTSVPLSRMGFEVVGIDNDPKVIATAQENGKKFGGKIEFKLIDVFTIDKSFEKDSFDACISGGLLEHFNEKEIKLLIDKQLLVAPLVICSMPVRTAATLRHYKVKVVGKKEACCDGIERNLWTEEEWLNDILKEYNIVEHYISKANPAIGGFNEASIVIKRQKP